MKKMNVKNSKFYFTKNAAVETNLDWSEEYDYRVLIDTEHEQIVIQAVSGVEVALPISSMWYFTQVIGKVQNEVITSLIGAPNNA